MSVSSTRGSTESFGTRGASENAAPIRSISQVSLTAQTALSHLRPNRPAPQLSSANKEPPAAPAVSGVSIIRFTTSNGSRYEGEGCNNIPHGIGRLEYDDGDVYEGHFVHGLPHGKGTLNYANGDVYEGDFSKGRLVGNGILIFAHGFRVHFPDKVPGY